MEKPPNLRLAIIGGGQLGMFLGDAALPLGIDTLVVTPDRFAPARKHADNFIVSNYDADGLAARIAAQADIVTFEFEAVPAQLLTELEELEGEGRLEIRPAVKVLKLLQNKATQKQWLRDTGLPTLNFAATSQAGPDMAAIKAQLGFPLVQKAQLGGYDGYGVQIIQSESELDKVWDVPSIFEEHAGRALEISVVVARSVVGETVAYPPVRMDFVRAKNVLDAVVFPSGLSSVVAEEAVKLAQTVVAKLGGIGVFAVEMFLLDGKRLAINEISPRVHNSGHHTLDSFDTSQFGQHVRAVCGLPLREPSPVSDGAVMRNLLYSDELEFMLGSQPQVFASRDKKTWVYWYGKSEPRSGRKMGHLTCLIDPPEDAELRMQQFIEQLRPRVRGAAA